MGWGLFETKDPTTIGEAEELTKSAYHAGIFCSIATGIAAYFGLAGHDMWSFVDAGLIFMLAWGVRQNSRICAVVLLLYFVGAKIMMWMEPLPPGAKATSKTSGIGMALIIFCYYARGVQGAFLYHKFRKMPPQNLQKNFDAIRTTPVPQAHPSRPRLVQSQSIKFRIFYISMNGEQTGPFSKGEVQELIKKGTIENSFFWKEGMTDWKSITEFPSA